MALVELLLSPLPSHVRTARLVVLAAARRAGLEDGLVDEIRLAVSESTSRAVALNARHAAEVPVKILVTDDPSGLTLSVTDAGPAAGHLREVVPVVQLHLRAEQQLRPAPGLLQRLPLRPVQHAGPAGRRGPVPRRVLHPD